MNFDRTPPPELLRGVELLEQSVRSYLARSAREVRTPQLSEVMPLWHSILSGAAEGKSGELSEEKIETARAALARRLGAGEPADAIALPTMVIRQGWYSGVTLRWDGVSRNVPVHVARDSVMTVHSIGGKGMGTSLQVALYTPDGRKFFERFAGLEPMDRYEMGGFGSGRGGKIVGYRRNDLFQDTAIIDEAVRGAFSPAIKPPDVAAD